MARRIRGKDAPDIFADLIETHGIPEHIRSDNKPKMVAKKLRHWLKRLGTKTIYISAGSPSGERPLRIIQLQITR